jgi:hypothetical protein
MRGIEELRNGAESQGGIDEDGQDEAEDAFLAPAVELLLIDHALLTVWVRRLPQDADERC